jgi:hypothetical protein
MINMELLLIVQEQMSQFMGRGEILSYRRMMRIDAYDRLLCRDIKSRTYRCLTTDRKFWLLALWQFSRPAPVLP